MSNNEVMFSFGINFKRSNVEFNSSSFQKCIPRCLNQYYLTIDQNKQVKSRINFNSKKEQKRKYKKKERRFPNNKMIIKKQFEKELKNWRSSSASRTYVSLNKHISITLIYLMFIIVLGEASSSPSSTKIIAADVSSKSSLAKSNSQHPLSGVRRQSALAANESGEYSINMKRVPKRVKIAVPKNETVVARKAHVGERSKKSRPTVASTASYNNETYLVLNKHINGSDQVSDDLTARNRRQLCKQFTLIIFS